VAALNHPNIVTVHSIERDRDAPFITMEYLEGQTLADIIPRGGLPLDRLLTLATQIVDAVVAAHGRGVPSNVMVLAGDRVKVLDFGLAKLRDAPDAALLPTQELTGEGKIVGTVSYMSPEQAEGKPVDERSDIFSLGVILYELATSERPFTGDTSLSVLSSILRETPRSVTELNPGLPRDMSRIVRHCLAKSPDDRYQSAKDLRHDLDDLMQSLSSGELSRVQQRWNWARLVGVCDWPWMIRSSFFSGAPTPRTSGWRASNCLNDRSNPARGCHRVPVLAHEPIRLGSTINRAIRGGPSIR
jgi:serine/threonine protein kinase